jgi:3-hydroxyacyl-CoA dehydrogenase/3a,7a,12a-trihydroxy-5b-cholest-24-enoyl-CoA hydratase
MVPTFAVAPALRAVFALAKEGKQAPGLHYGFDRVLHGEQYTEIRAPWPTSGKLTHTIKIKDIFDKGKNALVVSAITTKDAEGNELAYNEITTLVRGAGGWGGDRGPSADVNVPPERAPDAVVEEKTSANQALLYRLSGDWNPLHADPGFAKNFGFDRPILHGLCSFGFAARHVVSKFCPSGDPRFFKSIKARFAETVFPGETLVTEMWKENDQRVVFRTKVKERDKVVISNAAVELFKELPKKAEKPKAAAAAGAPATAEITSADVFVGIEDHIARHPELVANVGKTYVFSLKSPDSAWTLDLKTAPGSVKSGAGAADCTLELLDSDFMAMTSGKADAMKLYMGGKLKISGDLMASQKLDFLRKIDPKLAQEAIMKKRGAGPAAAPAVQAAPAAPKEAKAPAIMKALGERLAKNTGLAKEVGSVIQLDVTNPDGHWVLDLTGAGSVKEGSDAKATTKLRIDDADLVALTKDPGVAHEFYQRGKLRVDGDVAPARKLGFLKDLG